MKRSIALGLLLLSSTVHATDAQIARFISAQGALLEAQIAQLETAIELTRNGISDAEAYERIGRPSFAAVERALGESGYSVKSFYRFQADRQSAIDHWLSQHSAEADQLQNLQNRYDSLIQTLEGAR